MNNKDFGLYRDDGRGVLRNTSAPDADRKRKSIIKIFKECGLSITCEVNKKSRFPRRSIQLKRPNLQTFQKAKQRTHLN